LHLLVSNSGRPRSGLARVLSKLGYCSRSQARAQILSGRVRLNGAPCRDPERAVDLSRDRVEVDGKAIASAARTYLMLNKPRGLVTSRSDEQGRQTVYDCLKDAEQTWLFPVGRLDKASEGLILFTNDTAWAERITAPASHLEKTYHVQVNCLADQQLCERLVLGLAATEGENLSAKRVHVLRQGTRNSWLEVILDEGKNRQIRRLLEACGLQVLRLIRIAIGPLVLGDLAKGQSRHLTETEVRSLGGLRKINHGRLANRR
jgi:23S rRNA pseudouridine2605 synthase